MDNVVVIDGKRYFVTLTEIDSDETNDTITIKDASTTYGIKVTKLYSMIRRNQFPEGIVVKTPGSVTKFNRMKFEEFIKSSL